MNVNGKKTNDRNKIAKKAKFSERINVKAQLKSKIQKGITAEIINFHLCIVNDKKSPTQYHENA